MYLTKKEEAWSVDLKRFKFKLLNFYLCQIGGMYYSLVLHYLLVGRIVFIYTHIYIYIYFHLHSLIHRIMIFSLLLLQILDEAAVQKVFLKSLDNYIKWCNYLCIQPLWSKYGFLIFYFFLLLLVAVQ
jgi:hypothetical protein